MKIYSLALIMPLNLLTAQSMAFYQTPAPLIVNENTSMSDQQQAVTPAHDKTATAMTEMTPFSGTVSPVSGCNCLFCSMLRQIAQQG